MSVRSDLVADFKAAALSMFDDMVENTGEKFVEKTTLDAVSGAPTAGAEHIVRMLRDSLEEFENLPDETEIGDVVFTLLQDELPITPLKSGLVVYDGITYKIVGFIVDPADVLWQIVGRRA